MKREEWSSTFAFILAAVGSAVGIGNIWRFPYIMGQNGGPVFLIPYFICIFLFGLPLLLLEIGAGRHFKASLLSVFRRIKAPPLFAWLPLLFGLIILSYYLVITGWTLLFAVLFILKGSASISEINGGYGGIIAFAITAVFLYLADSLGIRKGIEKANKILLPLLFLSLILLAIFSLSLPSSIEKTIRYAQQKFSVQKLGEPIVWLFALSQVLFSLSLGYGILLTYGSYLRKKANIPRSAFFVVLVDSFVCLLATLIIFPLAFYSGIDPGQGFTLAFVSLPSAFRALPFGAIFGALFFLLLFSAAFSSSISMFEVPVAALIDEFKWRRKGASTLAFLSLLILTLPSLLSYSPLALRVSGIPILDAFDHFFGSLLAPFSAFLLCIGIAWFWKEKEFLREIGVKGIPGNLLLFLSKYLLPLLLAFLFLIGLSRKVAI